MSITRWDPFAEMNRLQSDLNRLWGETPAAPTRFAPAVDIFEDDDAIVLKAEVPGLKSEDLHVNVDNGLLTLSGERRLENEDKRDGYHRIERRYGAFTRSFALPKSVDPEKIAAELKEGVLELRLAKQPAAQARRIAVQSA